MRFLVQGTLYSDVIESGGGTGAATIKSHHNVGGLPDDLEFELVEPLRALFKDEVRAVGAELGLPERLVWRQPFPGPGLAIRIVGGEATRERLDILREADAILQDEIRKAGLYRELWQSFCVLPDIRTVGVQGDERTYGNVIVDPRGDLRRRDDRRLGAPALRPARADRLADDQRDPPGRPGGAGHHAQAARHDRVGVSLGCVRTPLPASSGVGRARHCPTPCVLGSDAQPQPRLTPTPECNSNFGPVAPSFCLDAPRKTREPRPLGEVGPSGRNVRRRCRVALIAS